MILTKARILSHGIDEGVYFIRIADNKIKTISKEMIVPLEGEEIIDIEGNYLTPGLIDCHTHLGLKTDSAGVFYADHNERSNLITPEVRAIDAINPQDITFVEARSAGITACGSGPGSANLIAGQYACIKTFGDTIDDILVNPYIAMKAALGENPKRVHNLTRMGLISKLREFLRLSKEYNLDKEAKYDHQLEAMKPIMNKEIPLKIHVHRADDIVSAIRVVEEFDLLYTLDHVTCGADILDYIHTKKRNLIVGPSLGARGKMELKGKGFENLVKLAKDQDISIITDAPVIPLQYLPICVGLAISKGLPFKKGLEAVTINPARMMGVEKRIGSIEEGKDADLVVWKEKPFITIQDPILVMIDGKIIS
ncbi:amidohydrolase family protein [Psychrilyobacter atlanticus]|uniref:amidohydrolase family protein n=1 Tax=Psychrilyobacter atlanticus TaxID=271091 RepID=UPI0004242414|nr:amidohydrolase family protein [Psychrilyobacter atlanticus]